MDRKEFLHRLDMYQHPYKYWIAVREGNKHRKRDPAGEQEAMEELTERYEFFHLKEGVMAEDIALRIKAWMEGVSFDAIYFDEDFIDISGSGALRETFRRFTGRGVKTSRRMKPFFKPDYSPDTLRSFFYPGGLVLVKRELAERLSVRSCAKPWGSAEFLRDCFLEASEVLHIPEVLYHCYEEGDIEYEEEEDKAPEAEGSVSCIILSKDNPKQLQRCIDSLQKSSYVENVKLDVLVIDNGSSEENRLKTAEYADKTKIKYTYEKCDFSFSRENNKGAALMEEAFPENSFLLFLNDDVEVPEGTCFLKKMMKAAEGESTGAVGVKLLYPGGELIQHVGISLLKTGPSHKLNGYPDGEEYYHGINDRDINVLGVTGACLMIRREVFKSIGGFDEALSVAYTDTELCVKLISEGYYNVCLNTLHLIPHGVS